MDIPAEDWQQGLDWRQRIYAFLTSCMTMAVQYGRLTRRYRAAYGQPAHLFPPRTFSEHIMHRVLFDRDPRLKITGDKLAMRKFVEQHAGPDYAVPVIGDWATAADIPWDTLPRAFVLKPNQSSGSTIIVPDRDTAERAKISREADGWMYRTKRIFPEIGREWSYQNLPRRLMVEPLLTGNDGAPVPELQVFTFGGRAALLQLLVGRKRTPQRRSAWFDREGRQVEISVNTVANFRSTVPPGLRGDAIAMAEQVASGFTSMRVDFYVTPSGLLVGELTPCSWGGISRFRRFETETLLGKLWETPDTSAIPNYAGSAEIDDVVARSGYRSRV